MRVFLCFQCPAAGAYPIFSYLYRQFAPPCRGAPPHFPFLLTIIILSVMKLSPCLPSPLPLRYVLSVLMTLILLWSCGGGNSTDGDGQNYSAKRAADEEAARPCLAAGRKALAEKDFATASAKVTELRKSYPMAITAREEALLLWDSIQWMEAEEQLRALDARIQDGAVDADSLQVELEDLLHRVEFYKRKLAHDRKDRQNGTLKSASEAQS